jgi:hypothetical protein
MFNIRRSNCITVIIVIVFLLSGCRYEEGPALNFTKVEKRIRGLWTLNTIYKNGENTDTESPTIVETKHAQYEFFKNKTLLIHYIHQNILCTSQGSWDFTDNKKNLTVAFTNQYYPVSRDYEIIKFKNKELKLRFTDDDGTVWTLVLTLDISYSSHDIDR